MRVLITGVTGYTGQHLARLYVEQGHEVVGIGIWKNFDDLPDEVHYLERDITDRHAMMCLILNQGFDVIHNLAAQTTIPESSACPTWCYSTNIIGADNVLYAADQCAFRPVVHLCSSSDVYGPVEKALQPITEYVSVRATNPYGASKIAMEYVTQTYKKLQTVITRLFTTYGPGQHSSAAVSSFIKQAVKIRAGKQEPIIRVGNIDNNRSFIDMREVVQIYQQLAQPGPTVHKHITVNVSGHEILSLRNILDSIKRVSEIDFRVEVDPNRVRPQDITLQVGDRNKMSSLLRSPIKEYSLDETIRDMLDYWQRRV